MSLTQQMSPDGRGPGRPRRGVFLAVAAFALVAVTVVVTLTVARGGGHKSQVTPATAAPTRFGIPSPQPATSTTSAQSGVMVLPPPARTAANGVPLGFPHTTEGAVSAEVRWLPFVAPGDEARQTDVLTTIGTPHFLSTYLAEFQREYHEETNHPGFWSVFTPVGQKVLSTSQDTVVAVVLTAVQVGDATGKTGSFYQRYSLKLVWVDEDWRFDDFVLDIPDGLSVPSSSSPEQIRASGWEEYQLG